MRILRSRTPGKSRRSPPPAPRTPNNAAPRPYVVTVHEGAAAADLAKHAGAFSTLCDRPGSGVSPGYIWGTFVEHKGPPDSMLAMTVTVPDGEIVAFAKCTLLSRWPGAAASRILFIDLVCRTRDEAHKGTGSVLLAELEAHAVRLGARFSMLQSLVDPSVTRAYYGAGFERGLGSRENDFLKRPQALYQALSTLEYLGHVNTLCEQGLVGVDPAVCRAMVAAQVNGNEKKKALPGYLNALGGEFYPPYNELHDRGSTVVMTKKLQRGRGRDVGAVKWQVRHGVFRRSGAYHLATYSRQPGGRLVHVAHAFPPNV